MRAPAPPSPSSSPSRASDARWSTLSGRSSLRGGAAVFSCPCPSSGRGRRARAHGWPVRGSSGNERPLCRGAAVSVPGHGTSVCEAVAVPGPSDQGKPGTEGYACANCPSDAIISRPGNPDGPVGECLPALGEGILPGVRWLTIPRGARAGALFHPDGPGPFPRGRVRWRSAATGLDGSPSRGDPAGVVSGAVDREWTAV